jgi:hypothetical protein
MTAQKRKGFLAVGESVRVSQESGTPALLVLNQICRNHKGFDLQYYEGCRQERIPDGAKKGGIPGGAKKEGIPDGAGRLAAADEGVCRPP